MTLLEQASKELASFTERWGEYAAAEGLGTIDPIMVVQVADAPRGGRGTRTPLDDAIDTINGAFAAPLAPEAFAHSFDEGAPIDVGSKSIRYLRPSQISQDPRVRVVFFKTALSTGWDCPRAEVMMSFRKAEDDTYIAQLIGRMVRTPLARRVERDETLNSVALFLPHYDAAGVARVVARLQDPEHEYVPPVEIDTARDTQVLEPRAGSEAILEAIGKVPSYVVPSQRKVKQTIRIMRLVRALGRDRIDGAAHDRVQGELLDSLAAALKSKQKDAAFVANAEGKGLITIGQVVYDQATGELRGGGTRTVDATAKNINDLFDEAGRRIGEGLHRDLWERLCDGVHDLTAIRSLKIQVAVLLSDPEVIAATEAAAEQRFDALHEEHVDAIEALLEERRTVYQDLLGGARHPTESVMRVRDRIVLPRRGDQHGDHLFVDAAGEFHADLNAWEEATITAERSRDGFLRWLRMVDRKDWALQVPYRDARGVWRPLYPDFLVFREDGGKVVVDLLDPHRPDIQDAVPKAKGLAEYAAGHGVRFGRIEAIMVDGDGIWRLDLKSKKVREALSVVENSEGLVQLYRGMGAVGEPR